MSSHSFTVLTHNILGPLTRDVTSFGFKYGDYTRLNMVIQNALKTDAEILCLQEFDEYVWNYLGQIIKDILVRQYKLVAYQPKGAHGGVIIYCKQKWYIREHGQIQLGYKQPGACAWGLLKHSNGQLVLVASIHLSRRADRSLTSIQTGRQQWDILLSELLSVVQNNQCSVVLTGDFNTLYSEVAAETIAYISQKLQLPVQMYQHGSWTQNNAKGEFGALDHVLYSGLSLDENSSWVAHASNPYFDKENVEHAIKKEKVNKLLIHESGYDSDHIPIFAKFLFDK